MENEYSVRITDFAEKQILEIFRYIDQTLNSPISARRIISLLRKSLNSLSIMPNRIPFTKVEPWHSQGVRRMVVKQFLVYFLVNEVNKTVQIIAVINEKRDQILQLSTLNDDKYY